MENIKNENYDERFKELSHDDKVNVLSNVSSKINKRFKPIYSESILNNIWNMLTEDSKRVGIEMYLGNE